MLIPSGSKLFTRNGFEPVESLEGKAVEVSSLPYYDTQIFLQGASEPQSVFIEKAHSSPSGGFEGMPMHPTTNFLAATPYTEKNIDLIDSSYFLNTIQTYHAGNPAILGVRVCPPEWIEYSIHTQGYSDAVSGLVYYATGLGELLVNKLDEVEYSGEHTNTQFILLTEANRARMFREVYGEGRWPTWKFIDYKNTRMYFCDGVTKNLGLAFCRISHFVQMMLIQHAGKMKLYTPTFDPNKIDKMPISHFTAMYGIRNKRRNMNADLAKYFDSSHYKGNLSSNAANMIADGCWPGPLSNQVKYLASVIQTPLLPLNFRTIPMNDGVVTVANPKSCWIPLESFDNVQWYNVYSATPKLVFVEAETGMLLLLSTIGGHR